MLNFVKEQPFKFTSCTDANDQIDFIKKTIVNYTNIDFSLTSWPGAGTESFYGDINVVIHLIDNLIDLHTNEPSNLNMIGKIGALHCTYTSEPIINHLVNNYGITRGYYYGFWNKYLNKYDNLNNYLIKKYGYKTYYNLEKYYDTLIICFFVMKYIKHTTLPKCLLKYKIIPFIYSK